MVYFDNFKLTQFAPIMNKACAYTPCFLFKYIIGFVLSL
jgi:hypothetical protein